MEGLTKEAPYSGADIEGKIQHQRGKVRLIGSLIVLDHKHCFL
jgi:hypothetical protein